MANVAKDLAQIISQSKSTKTGPYDTQATVKRVEGNTVWVSIPGGIDETPIDKTVNCSAGDKVQVRVSGGRAWITGNASAPPTDDKTANEAKGVAVIAQTTAVDAKETADAVEGIAVSASTTATTAKTIAEGVNEHFWHDSTGAHVTEVTQDEWNDPGDPNYHSGGNTLITTQGMAIRDGMTNLAQFGSTGAVIGQNASGESRSEISTSGMQIIQNISGTDYTIANLGYGPGTDSGGGTSDAPYYTLGSRIGTAGNYSASIGIANEASGYGSLAEGQGSIASGQESHAENASTASGWHSHSQNRGTIAQRRSQTTLGEFNVADTSGADGTVRGDYVLIIGNGTDNMTRSNALTVDWSGNIEAGGTITAEGHSSAIGDRQERNTSTTKATGTTWTSVSTSTVYANITAGTWLIQGTAVYENNSTGFRGLRLYNNTTSSVYARSEDVRAAVSVSGQTTSVHSLVTVTAAGANTIVLQTFQNSGGTRSVDYWIEAIRIA